ncbi:transcription factor bHLH130-like isoform X2 [Vigna unguiculata]|uniref:transcription factor bHLH130-like isoform X2 n=1 Tax=Vigna unguiculata TaxID=3917 RepID=UPI001016442D|nr:transcription factor bHLH130-like isoform X2 [Vigna unguiculata]
MSIVYSHAVKYSPEVTRMKPEMDSNIGQHCHQQNSGLMRSDHNHHHQHQHHQQQQQNYPPSTSSEMETMLAKLISSNDSETLQEFGGKPVKEEAGDRVSQPPQQHSGYSFGSSPQIMYQTQQFQGFSMPNGSLRPAGNGFDGSFSAVNSMASQNSTQTKMVSSTNCSNLIRQKSSPAGFFSNYSVDNTMRDVASFRGCDVSNGQAITSTSGLHGTLNFSSRPSSSCSTRMPQIAENGNEGVEPNCVESRNLRNMPSFTPDFWDGSAISASRTASNNCEISFSTSNAMDIQDEDFGYQKLGLTHHLSLPSSSTRMAATMEKLYQTQGNVPCKIRAKRGFATHPRSIAERERRTRISARIKKLQDLFPDKQTSTADMLDLAVEYIKDLQKQVKILADTRAKCTCTSNQKQ